MRLKLQRPIAFIDLEATGADRENDRIVEIAICKLHPDGSRENKRRLINPGIPIPPESSDIHHITDEMVKGSPTFGLIAQALLDYLKDCDIGGYNSNSFDIPMLYNEFRRVGINWNYKAFKMIDAGNIFKIQEPRTLSAAVKFYTGKELVDAHSAEADINATVDVFLAQMERYPDLPDNVDDLALFSNHGKPVLDLSGKFSYNDKGQIILNFGPNRGKPASEHMDFIYWMSTKGFPPDTMAIVNDLLYSQQGSNDDLPY